MFMGVHSWLKGLICAIYAQWFGFAQSLRGVIMHFVGL